MIIRILIAVAILVPAYAFIIYELKQLSKHKVRS